MLSLLAASIVAIGWNVPAWAADCNITKCRSALIKHSVGYARKASKLLIKCNDGALRGKDGYGPMGPECDDSRGRTGEKLRDLSASADAKAAGACGGCDPVSDLGLALMCPSAGCGHIDVNVMDGFSACAMCVAESEVSDLIAAVCSPTVSTDTQQCQRAIASEAQKFFSGKLKYLAKCNAGLEQRDGGFGPRGAACDSARGTQNKISRASQKKQAKVADRCCGGDGECGTEDDVLPLTALSESYSACARATEASVCMRAMGESEGDQLIDIVAQLDAEPPMCGDGTPSGEEECDPPGSNCPFCSQTQGGWGQGCSGNNPGCLRDANFASVFPAGLVVGDPDGPDADGSYALLLTSASAVEALLPTGGMASALSADEADPVSTSAGVFGGQIVAATINVAFDAAGIRLSGVPGAGYAGGSDVLGLWWQL